MAIGADSGVVAANRPAVAGAIADHFEAGIKLLAKCRASALDRHRNGPWICGAMGRPRKMGARRVRCYDARHDRLGRLHRG